MEEMREHIRSTKKLFRWQLDGHGGEEGTLVVEAFPKLCLVAGQDMVEVDFHNSYLSRFCMPCRDFAFPINQAGPFVMRQLYVEICMVVQEEFRIWENIV